MQGKIGLFIGFLALIATFFACNHHTPNDVPIGLRRLQEKNESALLCDPGDYWAHFNLASIYATLYASRTETDSTVAVAYKMRARCEIYYALKYAPAVDLKASLAITLENLGYPDEAIPLYEQFLAVMATRQKESLVPDAAQIDPRTQKKLQEIERESDLRKESIIAEVRGRLAKLRKEGGSEN